MTFQKIIVMTLPIAILAAGMVNENDLIFFDNGGRYHSL